MCRMPRASASSRCCQLELRAEARGSDSPPSPPAYGNAGKAWASPSPVLIPGKDMAKPTSSAAFCRLCPSIPDPCASSTLPVVESADHLSADLLRHQKRLARNQFASGRSPRSPPRARHRRPVRPCPRRRESRSAAPLARRRAASFLPASASPPPKALPDSSGASSSSGRADDHFHLAESARESADCSRAAPSPRPRPDAGPDSPP